MVMAGAAAAVAITILMVVCFVGDGCLVYELINTSKSRIFNQKYLFTTILYFQKRKHKLAICPVPCMDQLIKMV